MDEYIKVELLVDAKCLFMEVLGQTDVLDDMPGFGPEYASPSDISIEQKQSTVDRNMPHGIARGHRRAFPTSANLLLPTAMMRRGIRLPRPLLVTTMWPPMEVQGPPRMVKLLMELREERLQLDTAGVVLTGLGMSCHSALRY